MKEIKELYSFDLNVKEEDADKKAEPIRVVLRKPTRRILEDAEMYKAVKMSECIKRGILTKNMLSTKYANEGGVLTKEEAAEHLGRYKELSELQSEWTEIVINQSGKELSDKITKRLGKILERMNDLKVKISSLESSYSHLFSNTADVITQKEEVKYFVLMLTYLQREDDGETKHEPYFLGDTFEEKLEDFYEKEEGSDEYYRQISARVVHLVSFWITGAAESRADFDQFYKESSGPSESSEPSKS